MKKTPLVFDKIKFAVQRLKRGFCDDDLWGVNYWFLRTITNILAEFERSTFAYPNQIRLQYYAEHTEEYKEDIAYFEENIKDKLNITWEQYFFTVYKDSPEREKKYCDMWHGVLKRMIFLFSEAEKNYYSFDDEKTAYKDECLKEAFGLFVQYFDDLWT